MIVLASASSSNFFLVTTLLLVVSSCFISTTVNAFCPVVICPGFGNDMIDYREPLKQPSTVGLVSVLERRGFDPNEIYVVPIQRSDWIRVALGLFDLPNFYINKALPTGLGYGWYIQRLKDTIDLAYKNNNNKDNTNGEGKVLVIGHSAGGWLARAAMADGVWNNEDDDGNTKTIRTSDRIRGLVTVGAIHRPPEDPNSCVTRGALAYTDKSYPGAFLKDDGISYISVGGNAIVGDNQKMEDDDDNETKKREMNARRVAFTSYQSVCGTGDGICGDGVVPLDWSMLEGSTQIPLDNVLHSINEAGTTFPTDRWYGSENVIDRWLPTVLKEIGITTTNDATEKVI